jgi:5-methylcytosine-specific restriction endonuclease McrA
VTRQDRYRQKNRELLAAKERARRVKSPEAAKAARRWVLANPEQRKEHVRRWTSANLEKLAAKERNRHARLRSAPGSHTVADTRAIFDAQGGQCVYCRADLRAVKRHLDHKTPLSRGGSNWPDNLQWLCAPCNLKKGTKTAEEYAILVRNSDLQQALLHA